MSDLTLRNVKGSPLTNQEVDDNFSNLNADKYQSGDSPTFTDVTADSLQVAGGTGTQGTITWNDIDGTLDLDLGTATLQVGQEEHFYAKATEAIANGDVVMFAGAQGDHVLIAKANHSAVGFKPEYIMGVATQAFANNAFGYVTTFGKVRGLNTSTLNEGDILYSDPSNAGALTTTRPTAPDHVIQMAAVLSSNPAEGVILVRLTHFLDTDEVEEGSANLYFTDARAVSAIQGDASWNASDWDTAYSWGDHASAGYLTGYTESDPTVPSHVKSITTTEKANWNTAYGWGNHASVGYLTSASLAGYATQTYVNTAVSNLVDSAPATLDTLNELAAALGDDPNFATTVSTSIGTKWTQDNTKISNWDTAYTYSQVGHLPLVGGTITGDLVVSKDSARIRLYEPNGITGNYPSIEFDTANNQGLAITFNEFDGELPTSGYGLVVGPSSTNSQHPTTGNISFNVLGEVFAGTEDLSTLKKVWHAGDFSSTNVSNWNTAYTYSQVGHLPLSGGTIAGTLTVTSTADAQISLNGSTTTWSGIGFRDVNSTSYDFIWHYGNTKTFAIGGGGSAVSGKKLHVDGGTTIGSAYDSVTPPTDGLYVQGDIKADKNLWQYNNSTDAHLGLYSANGAKQRADSRNESTFARTHWYGVSDTGGTSNFRHAWYDGNSYVNVTAENDGVTFTGTLNPTQGYKVNGTTVIDSSRNLTNIGTLNGGTPWTSSNDGSGSGLDADLLDGVQASGFVQQNGTYTLASGYSVAQGDWGLRNTTPSGWIQFGPANSSYAHIYTDRGNFYFNVTSLYANGNTMWHAGNDGAGSGLDADLIDGIDSSRIVYGSNSNKTNNTGSASANLPSGFYDQYQGDMPTATYYSYLNIRHTNASNHHGAQIAVSFYSPDLYTRHYSGGNSSGNGSFSAWDKHWRAGNDGSGSGLDADLLDGQHGSYYLDAANFTGTAPTGSPFLSNFVHLGTATTAGYATDDGSWGSRLNVSSNVHAKIEVSQEANSMRSHWYAHTGQDSIKFGTSTSHDVEFQRASTTYLELESGGVKAYAPIRRSNHHSTGFLEGSYNNIGDNGSKTNPIYTIGSSYNPADSTLSNMYGIGYCYTSASFITGNTTTGGGGWGMYVASDGDARIFLNAGNGTISTTGQHYAAGSVVWNAGNDGSGSGLDADLLDGNHASYFYSPSNVGVANAVNNTGYGNGNFTYYQASGTFNIHSGWHGYLISNHGDGASYYRQVIALPFWGSPTHSRLEGGTQRGIFNMWTAENDGSGSGLDADLLDGYNAAENGGNTIHKIASNGYSQLQNWTNVAGSGIYSSTTNGAHFYPNSASSYGTWRIAGSRGSYTGILFDYAGGASNAGIHIMYDGSKNGGIYTSSGWHTYFHEGNRCLGVNSSTTSSTYELYVSGDIYATGNITAYSDRRKKENIETIEGALDTVCKLRGVSYTKIGSKTGKTEIGVIAQEVDEVLPEVVTYADDVDEYSVAYGNMAGVFIEAIKELTKQVEDLKAELEVLKNERA